MKISIAASKYAPPVQEIDPVFAWNKILDAQTIRDNRITGYFSLFEYHKAEGDTPHYAIRIWNVKCPVATTNGVMLKTVRKHCPNLKGYRLAPKRLYQTNWGPPVGRQELRPYWQDGDDRCILCVK